MLDKGLELLNTLVSFMFQTKHIDEKLRSIFLLLLNNMIYYYSNKQILYNRKTRHKTSV